MKLPTTAKAVLGVAALMGVTASTSAANLVLSAGNYGVMPTDVVGGPSGTVLASVISPDTIDLPEKNFTVKVESKVTTGNPENPYGTDKLSFWYKMSNVNDPASGNRPLQGLSIPMPAGLTEVALNQTPGLTSATLGALTAGGGTVAFTWVATPLEKGITDGWVVIYTPYTGTQFTEGAVGAQDGTTEDALALVPVPEPATYAGLFALGLAGFAAFRRFRA